jgi:hypothetical protein
MDHLNQNIIDTKYVEEVEDSDIKLQEEDFEYLYKLLTAPIVDFDCGAICSLTNEGVPVCCESDSVVPILYKNEYKYVSSKCSLWREFYPETKEDKKLIEESGYDDVLCICRGAKDCNREYRSMVCRTFPFYPYLDKKGNFLGLTYNYDFEGSCLLIGRPKIVNTEYIHQAIDAWKYIFKIDSAEKQAHMDYARTIDRKRRGKTIHVLSKKGVKLL